MRLEMLMEELENMGDIKEMLKLVADELAEVKVKKEQLEPIYKDLCKEVYESGDCNLGDGKYLSRKTRKTYAIDQSQLKLGEPELYHELFVEGYLELPTGKIKELSERLKYLAEQKETEIFSVKNEGE